MSSKAFTSKVGYHTQSRNFTSKWGPVYQDWGKLSQTDDDISIVAYSNRAPLIKSNRVNATNYHRKIGNIVSLTSPRVQTSSHRYKADSSIACRGIELYGVPHGSSYGSPSVSIPQWMTDKVVQDCQIKLSGLAANLMEDFGQAKQTVNLLWGIFSTIVKLYTLARKGQWRKLRRTLRGMGYRPSKKVSNGWLAYYYGIRPLVGTMDALCQAARPKQKVLRAQRKLEQPVDPNDFVRYYLTGMSTGAQAKQLVRCGMTVAVKMDSTLAYWSTLGFTGSFASDALVTAWALTPYSFIVDWVLPVERFLRTRTWGSGIEYRTGYISKVLKCNGTFRATNVMTGAGDSGDMPVVQVDSLQFQRLAYNTFTPPSGLSLKLSLSSTQAINALALINQRRK